MTGNPVVDGVLAVILGVVIWRISRRLLRMLSTPPDQIDPEDVVAVDQDFKCTVCGAELTMRSVNLGQDQPPRHCREDMVPVWRP